MVTTVTDNSPQSINTSLFSLDRDIQEIKKVTDKLKGISLESDVISVNGKRGIVELNASDVGALPDTTFIPSKTSDLENDSGFVTIEDVAEGYVPLTRTINDKPLDEDITLTASDVGALPDTTVIPTKTSELTNDSGFITSSDSITGNAATATKAEQDADGNVITDTYATKAELDNKSDIGHKHDDIYYTESEIDSKLANKVDKVSGKGLSTNDFTTAEKEKLAGLSNYDDNAVKTLIANEAKAREDADKALQTAIDGKADASHTHDDRYYTETEINEKIYDINEKIGTLQENKNDLLDMCSDLYDKVANETSSRTEADTALQNQITSNKSAIDTLNGTGEGSVKKTVSDEIAKVVANAPGDFDTLKEISDWIDTHEDSASAMNTAIQANATNLSNHINNKSNPHSVTKAQVGLGNVVNTGDSATPVSGGTTKFTTGGAYTELAKKNDKITVSEDYSAKLTDDHALTLITAGANPTTGKNRKLSQVWTYIKGKADSVYAKLSHTHTKSQITDFAHTHDDRYYTESEVDTKLAGKANSSHTHTKSQITDFAHTHDDRYYTESEIDTKLSGKSDTGHTHDDRYYTETEIDTKLAGKANSSHTHNYLPLSGGAMTGNIKYKGSQNTYDMIKFIDNANDAYGNGIAIGGGGLTIIGGGESSNTVAAQQTSGGDEKMIIANDAAIDFYTNTQNGFSSAKHITMNTDGTITAAGFNGKANTARTADIANKLKSTQIPAKTNNVVTDLNNYTTPGFYHAIDNTSYTNAPIRNFSLQVIQLMSSYVFQVIYAYSSNLIYTRSRIYTTSGYTWTNWVSTAKANHTHDDRYYTESEIDTKLAGKANSSHTHTKSQITDFPTSLLANGGTADKATKDGNGNNIANTYMPKSGGTFTGIVTGTEFHARSFFPKDNIDSGYGFEVNANGETYLWLTSNNAMTIDSPKGININGKANHSGIILTREGSFDGATVSIGQTDGIVTIGDPTNENNGYTTINNDCKMLYSLNVDGGISVKGTATLNGSDIITKDKFSFDETTATLTITM